MPKANFVCTICSQTFTRRWRGKTHSINLHSGSAEIVRFVDYIVGRLNGQYFAGDPSLYRSKKSNVLSHENNSTVFDRERVFKTNKEKSIMGDRISENVTNFSQFQPVTQPRIQQNEDPIRKDPLSDIIEESKRVIIKTAKLKKILERHGSPEAVQQMMNQVASNCMTMGSYAPLDMALDEIAKWDQFKESRDYLLGS
jgi:hypothetical protein